VGKIVLDIRVVAGYRVEDLLTAVKPLPVKVIFNPHFARGMYSSVQVAVGSLEPEIEAFFILPVDIPLVSAETIRKMVEAFGKSCAPKIIYPVYNGRRGHPPLIWVGYKEEIIEEIQPEGLRSFLNKHEPHAFELTVADEAVLLEMDTLEEYRRLSRLLEHPLSLSVDESLFLLEKLQPHEKVRRHCKVVAALACLVVR
jgi:molybdenum cofactor cytidylyltransferase